MISKSIFRRLSNLQLNSQYKQRFMHGLQRISRKHESSTVNKSLITKKVCLCYLKICEQLISLHNIPSSMTALQFIKSLVLDIYEGESYQLWLIKIRLHLLMVRCFDLVIGDNMGDRGGRLVKGRGGGQQRVQFCRKKGVYVERVKLFCQELQRGYFSQMLHKDYYSNLQQLHLLILNHQLQKLIHNHKYYNQSHIPQQLSQIKNTLLKLYELLKCHILQLNQLFFYLQKKVYQILTQKVKIMIELFVVEAVVLFVERVGRGICDQEERERRLLKQRELKKGVKGGLVEIGDGYSTNLNSTQKNTKALKSQPSSQQHSYISQQIRSDTTPSTPTSYQSIKSNFLSQQLSSIWQKYAITFSKIPNNVNKTQVFQKVQTIINSWVQISERNYQNKNRTLSMGKSHELRLKSEECFGESNCVKSTTLKQDTNKSQLWRQQINFSKNNSNQRTKSNFQMRKNQQLVDFINFVKEEDQRQKQQPQNNSPQSKKRRQDNNSTSKKQEQKNIQLTQQESVLKRSKQPAHKLINQGKYIEPENQQHYEYQMNTYQRIGIPEVNNNISKKKNDELLAKPIQRDSIKKSNFRVFKDVKNVFEYICQKNMQEPSQHPNTQPQQTQNILQQNLIPQTNIMQNLSSSLKSQGFKKLNSVKTHNIKLLQNIKQSQIQRLHRIKSVDIMRTTQSIKSSLFNSPFHHKQKSNHSQSMYFPALQQMSHKQQKSQPISLSKNTFQQTNKLFIFNNAQSKQKIDSKTSHTKNKETKPKQPLKIRSSSIKINMDTLIMDRFNVNLKKIQTDGVIDDDGQKDSSQSIEVGKRLQDV